MKYAICVSSPFQLLNALNLVLNHLDPNDEKDLFFHNYSSEMESYLKKIKTYNCFDNYYTYNIAKTRNYIDDIIQARFPSTYLNELFKHQFRVKDHNYDYITVTSGTEIECALSRVYRGAKTIAYDDGLGSYVGDMIHDKKMHILWRIFGRNNDSIRPEALYINNIGFCESKISYKHVQLAKFGDWNKWKKQMISDVFDLHVSLLFSKCRICYITQPAERLLSNISSRDSIEKVLSHYGSDCIIRFHPRDLDRDRFKNIFHLDNSKGIWELICQNAITEKHILVGSCSTAQLAPKLFYNIEPWLVFTHRIYVYNKKFQYNYNNLEELVKKISKKYKNKHKILAPKNINELEECLILAMEHEV